MNSTKSARSRLMALAAVPTYRDGGHVRGPGTGTSDSINAKLSDGEYVMPADTVRKVGVRRLQDLVDMTHTPSGNTPRPTQYADGGYVRRPGSFDIDGWAQQQGQQRAAATQASQAAAQSAMAEADAVAQEAAAAKRAQATAAAPTTSPASVSLDQRVSQIPTGAPPGGPTAPATTQSPGGVPEWVSGSETGRNIWNAANALPGVAGALPVIARTGGAITSGINAASRLLNAGVGAAAISAIPGAAAAQTPASAAGAGRGMVNPPAVNPMAPPLASPPRTLASIAALPSTTSDVTRVGNSYSGNNVAGDITVNGRGAAGGFMNSRDASTQSSPVGMTPEAAQRAGLIGAQVSEGVGARERLMAAGTGQAPAGQVSQQNMTAADNLAGRQQQDARTRLMALANGGAQMSGVQAPVVRHSGNDWQSRKDLENARTSAMSISNRPEWSNTGMNRFRGGQPGQSPDVAAYQAMLSNDLALRAAQPGVDQATMRENAGLQREGMQQAGETQRTNVRAQGVSDANQIARGRLTLEQIAAGYTNRSADRMDRAQADLENARTPDAQKSARERLMALAGREPQNEWSVQVTPATKNADGSSTQGSVWRYNKQTGETVRVDGGPQTDITKDPRAIAIRDNPQMTYEQKKAALTQLGF